MAKTTTKSAPKTTTATATTAPSAKAAAIATPTATPTATKAPTLTVASKPASTCCGGQTTCATPSYEQIAQRAYEIWVAKGRPQGQDIENWKQAEADLKRGSLVTAA